MCERDCRRRMMGLILVAALAAGGCASSGSSKRTVARTVLVVLAAGTAAMAVGAAVKGKSIENDLRDDLESRTLTGPQFTERDNEGRNWNRVARASTLGFGLSLLGLGILWEMRQGDRMEQPPKYTPADDKAPIIPVPRPVGAVGKR